MLGSHFLRELKKKSFKITSPTRNELFNIYDYISIFNYLKNNKFDLVINCISKNGINPCFDDKHSAFKINSLFPQFLSQACERVGTRLLLFSTEMIFAESESLPNIKTKPNPNTYYGITKYFGEVFNSNNTIVRLPLLVSKKPNNQMIWKLINKLNNNEFIKVSQDEYSTPVFAEQIAETIIEEYIKKNLFINLIHFASAKRISLYETIKRLATNLSIDTSKILKCNAKEFKAKEQKPLNSGLFPSHTFSKMEFL